MGERPEQTELTELTEEQDLMTAPVSAHHLEAIRRLGRKEGPFLKASFRKDTARLQRDLEPPIEHPRALPALHVCRLAYLLHRPVSLQTVFLCFPDCVAGKHDFPIASEFP